MKCKKCELDKNKDDFYGSETTCKTCRSLRNNELKRSKRILNDLPIKITTHEARELLKQHKKYCPKCKKIKDIDEFSTMKVRGKIASHCRECNREMLSEYYSTENGKIILKERYNKNKLRLKNNKLKRDFGITYDEYKEILNKQQGRCAICGKTEEENGKMLAVDHNHETMKNRELLCSSCNILIGFIEKNKLNLRNIENYINKHKIN